MLLDLNLVLPSRCVRIKTILIDERRYNWCHGSCRFEPCNVHFGPFKQPATNTMKLLQVQTCLTGAERNLRTKNMPNEKFELI